MTEGLLASRHLPEGRMLGSKAVNPTSRDLLNHAIEALRDAINALEQFAASRSREPDPGILGAVPPLAAAQETLVKMIAADGHVPDWHVLARERLRKHFTKAGPGTRAMLIYMMERPGLFIPQEELMLVVRTKSKRSSVIKVYICHLRNMFKSLGWGDDMIETGFRSYSLSVRGFDRLVTLIRTV